MSTPSRRRFLLALGALGASASLPTRALTFEYAKPAKALPRILICSDSLSAFSPEPGANPLGWAQRLDALLTPAATVIPETASSRSIRAARDELPILLFARKPLCCLMILGTEELQGAASAERVEEYIEDCAAFCQQAGARPIFTLPGFGAQTSPSASARALSGQMGKAMREAAKRHGGATLPPFTAPLRASASLFAPDGVHPSAAAQTLLAVSLKGPLMAAALGLDAEARAS